eukprot:10866354-Alexandrium_andersonii.AAC.1
MTATSQAIGGIRAGTAHRNPNASTPWSPPCPRAWAAKRPRATDVRHCPASDALLNCHGGLVKDPVAKHP